MKNRRRPIEELDQEERKPVIAKTRCPNCDATVKMERPREGEIIACPGCGVELEVINADPFEIEFTDEWQNE